MPDFRRMPAMKAETSPTRVAARVGANPAAAKTPATDAVTLQARAGLNSVAGRQVSARTESVPAVKTERRRREKIVKSVINETRSSGIGSGDNAFKALAAGGGKLSLLDIKHDFKTGGDVGFAFAAKFMRQIAVCDFGN